MSNHPENKNHAANVWDTIYQDYREPDIKNKYIYSKLENVLGKYISPKDSILEAGCGSGYMVAYFQNRGHYSVGLDSHSQPLKVATDIFKVKHVIQGDLFSLPFEKSSFDVVWNEGVLEHFNIHTSTQAAKEMARVSKKYVIIDVPNRYSFFVVAKILKKMLGRWPYGYEESYSIRRLKGLMERAGLEVVGIHGVYLAPPLVALPESMTSRILRVFGKIEDSCPWLATLFGYHLVMVGKVIKSEKK